MTINEIAKLADVSRATVSRYLNNGYISEEKAQRVRKVIAQTGYVPSTQAQQLRTKKTKLIGVILPKINSESISRIVAGISLILSIYHDDFGAAEAVTDLMIAAGGKHFGLIGATSRDVAVGQERRDGCLGAGTPGWVFGAVETCRNSD